VQDRELILRASVDPALPLSHCARTLFSYLFIYLFIYLCRGRPIRHAKTNATWNFGTVSSGVDCLTALCRPLLLLYSFYALYSLPICNMSKSVENEKAPAPYWLVATKDIVGTLPFPQDDPPLLWSALPL